MKASLKTNFFHSLFALVQIVLLGVYSESSQAQSWSFGQYSPEYMQQHAVVKAANGKIYTFGGADGGYYFTHLSIYDPSNDSWSSGAEYPILAKGLCGALGADGLIYSFSGYADSTAKSNCYKYNPITDSWTAITNIPNPVWGASATSYGDKIYVIGGEGDTAGVQIYNTLTNTWSTGASIPQGRALHTADLIGEKIYVTGGGTDIGDSIAYANASTTLLIYDIIGNNWSTGASMSLGRFQAGSALGPDGRIYVFGGASCTDGPQFSGGFGEGQFGEGELPLEGEGPPLLVPSCSPILYSSVEIYDPVFDYWVTGNDIPYELSELDGAFVGPVLYVFGGYDGYLGTDQTFIGDISELYPSGSGFAIELDGVDDFISADSSIQLANQSFTIEVWARRGEVGSYNIIASQGTTSTNNALHIGFRSDNTFTCAFYNDDLTTATFYTDTNWHHWATTYDATTNDRRIYRDGVLVANDIAINDFTGVGAFLIGVAWDTNSYFKGGLDELRIWNTALSQTAIRSWMTQRLTVTHPGLNDLLAYYQFDNNSGTILTDKAAGNDAELLNGPLWLTSGAAIGDRSVQTYGGSTLTETLSNGNQITLNGFAGADGIHLYVVTNNADGSSFPGSIFNPDTTEYFGVFRVGGTSYDVTIDYTNNANLNGQGNEQALRGIKRSDGTDSTWEITTGYFGTNNQTNKIFIPNQTGTEYVIGFSNASYPDRSGSGYALDFDGTNDYVIIPDANELSFGNGLVDQPFTLTAWVSLANFPVSVANIITKSTPASLEYQLSIQSNGTLFGVVRDASAAASHFAASFQSLTLTKWTHVAMSYDGSGTAAGITLYLNGQDVTVSPGSIGTYTAMENGVGPLNIGSQNGLANYANMKTDEIQVWSEELGVSEIRDWMTKKINASHPSISNLVAYYRCDESAGDTLFDLMSSNNGVLTNMDPATDWVRSGAALGDESIFTYGGTILTDTLSNNNQITISDFGAADGIHLYTVSDTAMGSTYPSTISDPDSLEYFGVFMVGGSSYDVTIDYSANPSINGQPSELQIRGLKRSGGDDTSWEEATGYFSTNTSTNTISVLNQTGTEYVTGFANSAYPERPGSGYALNFNGTNAQVAITHNPIFNVADGDFTFAAWVYPTASGVGETILSKGHGGGFANDDVFIFQIQNSKIALELGNQTLNHQWRLSNTDVPLNEWSHVVASFDHSNNEVTFFLNGVNDGTGVYTNAPYNNFNTNSTYIGRQGWGCNCNYFDGVIDELSIWDAALDSNQVREWMTKKINASHPNLNDLIAYYRFDDATGTILNDLVGGNNGNMLNFNPATDWVRSGAALGDESKYTYGGSSLIDTLSNNNVITLDDFPGADGIHLYTVNDTATGSSYPSGINNADSTQYFGVFKVGAGSYDVEIDYSNNTSINGQANEQEVRGLKRSGGDDGTWQAASGEFRTDIANNTISILNQTGTEYVTGFTNFSYPERSGSGYAINFDNTDDFVRINESEGQMRDLTITAWIYRETSVASDWIWWRGNGASNAGSEVYLSSAGILSYGENDGTYIFLGSNSVVPDNEWIHIAVTKTGTNVNIYLNGILDATTNTFPTITVDTGRFAWGARDRLVSDGYFDGVIDEATIFNVALSQNEIREWMTKKITTSHDSIAGLLSYYRFDENNGDTLYDLVGTYDGVLMNSPTWVRSGAALGDESIFTYGGSTLTDTLFNNNQINVSDFSAADGMHLYVVNNNATGSTFPSTIIDVDSAQYFGVFKVGSGSYDVEIDYSNNTAISGQANEQEVRGLKRSGGNDAIWSLATGELRTNIASNTISILNQTGTEYVTGFTNTSYPVRPGSGYALDFDGSDDRVVIPNESDFDFTTNFTLSAWVNQSVTSADQKIITKFGDIPGNDAYSLALVNSIPRLDFKQSGAWSSLISSDTINTDEWHFITATFDGTDAKIYVDGILTGTENSPGALDNSTATLKIGGWLSGNAFNGLIDEVRVWSTALDSADIRKWMTKKLTASHDSIANLVAYYRFDEAAGSTLADLAGGNDGVLTNMDANTDWVLSGASLGDESSYDYSGSPVILGSSSGDTIEVDHFSGGATGIHVYRVDEAPNDTGVPLGMSEIDTTHYYGFFLAGGTNPKANVELDYSNNATYVGTNNGDDLQFAGRDNNADIAWVSKASPMFSNFAAIDSLKIQGQASGTELLVGRSSFLTPPGSGYALDFDGTNDHVIIPHTSSMNVSAVTIETWIRWDGNSSAVDFICGKNVEELELHLGDGVNGAVNSLRFIPTTDVYLDAPANILAPNRWYHIAAVYDPAQSLAMLYLDGISQTLVNSNVNPLSTPITQSTVDYYLGIRFNGTLPYEGRLDEFRMWNTALDSNEIRNWMTKKLNMNHPNLTNLVSYYRFDQQSDTTLFDLFGGNHGTLTNMDENTDWVTSGAAIGDMSAYTYGGTDVSIMEPNGDSIRIDNFDNDVVGAHIYYVAERSNATDFYGAESVDTNYYFGVHKVGEDTATYDVSYYYGNSAQLTGNSNEYRVALAKRDNNADQSWEADWFVGTTNTSTNTIFLPNQTGTEYAGIVSANNALNFDGVNDFVNVPSFPAPGGDFTLESWVTLNSYPGSWRAIMEWGVDSPFFGIQGSKPQLYQAVTGPDSLMLNTWYHIAVSHNNTTNANNLYVNGQLVSTAIGNPSTSGTFLQIGGRSGYRWEGNIDEVRVWSRELCGDEIAAHVNCQFDSIGQDSLLAYYSFNQGAADSTNTGLDSLIDQSGNGHNGTLTNFALSGTSSNWVSGAPAIVGSCGPVSSAQISIAGNGLAFTTGQSALSLLDSTFFGEVNLNEAASISYTIFNTGSAILNIDSIEFTGADASSFNVLSSPASIAVGDSGIVQIEFTALVEDTNLATVNIYSNACSDGLFAFDIGGDGFYIETYAGFGNALSFDGVDDYIIGGGTAPLNFSGASNFTIETWINPSIPTCNVFYKSHSAFAGLGISIDLDNYKLNVNLNQFSVGGWTRYTTVDSIALNQWTHIGLTKSGGTVKLYIDGEEVATVITGVSIGSFVSAGASTFDFTIGNGGYLGTKYDGLTDEFRIWNVARTAAEIADNYNNRINSPLPASLVTYYNFDQQAIDTIATDISATNRNANLMNMTGNEWVIRTDSLVIGSVSEYANNGDTVGNVFGWREDLDTVTFQVISGNSNGIFAVDNLSGLVTIADSSFLDFETDSVHYLQVQVTAQGYPFVDTTIFAINIQDVYEGPAGALNFDGVDDYVLLTGNLSSTDLTELTIEAWVNVEDSTGNFQSILSAVVDTFFHFQMNSIGNNVVYTDSGVLSLPIIPITPFNTWKHVAMVVKSGESRIFVNGSQIGATVTTGFTEILQEDTLRIGSGFGGVRYLNGDMDELRVWNRALDSSEIQANMNCELSGTECGLLAYYNFNSSSALASLSNVSDTILGDSSANANNGVLQNFALNGLSSNWSEQTDSVSGDCSLNADVISPTALALDSFDLFLGTNGIAILTADSLDNGSCDIGTGISSFTVSQDSFNCVDTAVGTDIWFYATDGAGNTDSTQVHITVSDTSAPVMTLQNITIYLDTSGNVTLNPGDMLSTYSDNCSLNSLVASTTSFSCADLGPNLVTLTSTDLAGNITSASAMVTVIDVGSSNPSTELVVWSMVNTATTTYPQSGTNLDSTVASGFQDFNGLTAVNDGRNVWNNPSSLASVSVNSSPYLSYVVNTNDVLQFDRFVIHGAAPTGGSNMQLRWNVNNFSTSLGDFTPGGVAYNLTSVDLSSTALLSPGSVEFRIYFYDSIGDVYFSGTGPYASLDGTPASYTSFGRAFSIWGNTFIEGAPTAIAQDITVYLDNTGNVSITPAQVDSGSFDICGLQSLSLDVSSFTCADLGANTVILTVADSSGNSDAASATITVLDTISPQAIAQNISVYLDGSGSVTILPSQLDNGSIDNCGIASFSANQSTLSCTDTGGLVVEFYAFDASGNSDTAFATITVLDTIPPTIYAFAADTVVIDANGGVLINAAQLDSATSDNCSSVILSVSNDTFDCANIGLNTVMLYATDVFGNVDSVLVNILVQDLTPPIVIATDGTVYVDASGIAILDPQVIGSLSSDNCDSLALILNTDTLDCSYVGGNALPVLLTGTDEYGNFATNTAFITVLDSISPVAIAQNDTVYLDVNGNASITPVGIDNGSSDNCAIDSVGVSQTTFTCADAGMTLNLDMYVFDVSGNSDTTSFMITVLDTLAPEVFAVSYDTLYLDGFGNATVSVNDLDSASSDNCAIASRVLSDSTFNCSEVGINVITIMVTDVNGNVATATTSLNIIDTFAPMTIAIDTTLYLDATGNISVTPQQIGYMSTDNCTSFNLALTDSTWMCVDADSTFAIILTGTDSYGNTSVDTSYITVLDTTPPVAQAQNVTVYLDGTGNASILPVDVNNGSNDICTIDSLAISQSSFDCTDAGSTLNISLYAFDPSGNSDTAIAMVTVLDTLAPLVYAVAYDTVYLGTNGQGTISVNDLDSASNDNCAIATRVLSDSTFDCTNVGVNVITLLVTDVNGNADSAVSSLNIIDTFAPVTVAIDTTIYLDASGNVSVTPAEIGYLSTDNCATFTLTLSDSSFTCVDADSTFAIILTGSDSYGNTSIDTSFITVLDIIPPAAAAQNLTVYLDANGDASILPSDADNGSIDNCSIDFLATSDSTFDCADAGQTLNLELYAFDPSGNSDTATFTVTVLDTLNPLVYALAYNTLYLDATGNASVSINVLDSASSDNCAIATRVLSDSTFTCADVGLNLITLVVTDVNGNSDSAITSLNIIDSFAPITVAIDTTLYLDSSGNISVTPQQIGYLSIDNCDTFNLALSDSSWTCADAGSTFAIILTGSDSYGNSSTDTGFITILDTIAPTAIAQNDTFYLDTTGNVSILPTDLDNGSNDNCSIDSLILSDSSFTCSDVGSPINVDLIVVDPSGNRDTATAQVTILDTLNPQAFALAVDTVYLNATGNGSITMNTIDSASTDNCSIVTRTLSDSTFDCTEVGLNIIKLTVTDASGLQDSAFTQVNVIDTFAPVTVAIDTTLYLDSSGNISVTPTEIGYLSTDNCATFNLALSDSSWTCTDAGSMFAIILTGSDSYGNISTDTAFITIIDAIAPQAIAQNDTLYLDATGNVSITPADIDNGSNDNCSVDSVGLSQTAFTCADAGQTLNLELYAFDPSGNSDTATFAVTVLDTLNPLVYALAYDTLYLDGSGNATVSVNDLDSASSDNCAIATRVLSDSTFTCADVGLTLITLVVIDASSNSDSAITQVNVIDTFAPVTVAIDTILYLDSSGNISVIPQQIGYLSTDNCDTFNLALSDSAWTCADAGQTFAITLIGSDSYGNTTTAISLISIADSLPPIVNTQNITVYLDSSGNASIAPSDVNNGSFDNCSIDSLSINVSDFNCSDAGSVVAVLLTANDSAGNSTTDTAFVSVFDTIAPTIVLQSITVALDSFGTVMILASDIDNGSWDSCGIDTTWISQSTFSCADAGLNTVWFFALDNNGNVDSLTTTVEVIDTIAPTILIQNIAVSLDSSGNASIIAADLDNGTWDSCGVASTLIDVNSFDCATIGINTVWFYATDVNGNIDSSLATVTVQDTIAPVLITQNITVSLDTFGLAVINVSDLNNGTWDSCGIASLLIDVDSFNCSNIGPNTVWFYASDVNGNEDSVQVTVTVQDTLVPIILTQNITVSLDSFGSTFVVPSQIDLGTWDSCGVATLELSVDTFDCSSIGANNVWFIATDVNGNTDSVSVVITIQDTLPPFVLAQNIIVSLDSFGDAIITASDLSNGSWDSCGIASISIDVSVFDCSNIGANPVWFTATDVNGNSDSAQVVVTVQDTLAPIVLVQNVTIALDSFGDASIVVSDINNGTWDSCGIVSTSLSKTAFDCGDVGANNVWLIATDVNGNVDSSMAVVTVLDTIAPTIVLQNLTVQLDTSGNVLITPSDINNGSWDSCGIASTAISMNAFDCGNIGPNTVWFYATDVNGNLDSASTIVTIEDTLAPIIFATNDTVYLDVSGQFTLDVNAVDSGTYDSCGIAQLYLTDSVFTCSDAGTIVAVWFVAEDVNANIDSVSIDIMVIDTIRPEIVCVAPIIVPNDVGECGALVSFNLPTASDNCNIDSIIQIDVTGLDSGMIFPVGITELVYVAYDPSMNTDTCSFTIEVQDVEIPVIICAPDTLICDSVFTFATPSYTDNCSGFTVVQIEGIESGEVYPVGNTINTFMVEDSYGNSDTCSFIVTRFDFPSQASAGIDEAFCEALSFDLEGNNPLVGNGIWSILVGQANFSDSTEASASLTGFNYGTTTLEWRIENGVCPIERDTVSIENFETASQAQAGQDVSLCDTAEAVITALTPKTGLGVWIDLNSGLAIADSLSDSTIISGLGLENYSFVWKVTNGVCPSTFDTIQLFNRAIPVVIAQEDKFIFETSSIELTAQSDIAISWDWSPKQDILGIDTSISVLVRPIETTVFTVKGTSEFGCSAQDNVLVTVNDALEVPTAFTPDGDNFNDVWNIKELENYPECEVEIFNRAGNSIYKSVGYQSPWDGTYKGEDVPIGAYYFVIRLNDEQIIPLTGSVTVIR